jgi:cell division protein FtsI/penicillin-binding protein 2
VDFRTIYADPQLVSHPRLEAKKLAPLLHRPAHDLARLLAGTRPNDEFEFLRRQVDPAVARRVRALSLAGIATRTEPRRLYPNGRLASQVLGFVGIDGNGLSGVEKLYDGILAGRAGSMTLQHDPAGRALPQAGLGYTPPTAGRSLFLTIDKAIQYRTERALDAGVRTYHADSASAIVMQPHTGQVLAMANYPDFNPNDFWRWPQYSYRNRAVTDLYEPGSNFKLVTASAALQARAVTPRTKFMVPEQMPFADRVIHDSHYHPTERMSVRQIIVESSNVGTVKIGLRLGGAGLQRYIYKYGFGRPTGVGFPGEASGIVVPRTKWSGSTIANLPIGQGIAVTAMQMACAYSVLANHGVWVRPSLLYATMSPSGKARKPPAPATRQIVSRRTARQMTSILTGVVRRGTGVLARIPGYAVAGKTGTAQKALPTGGYGHSYVASFAGYAPARHPAVVAIVVYDNPRPIWGGYTAAPTFKTILEFALGHLGVPPTGDPSAAAQGMQAPPPSMPSSHD